MRSRPDSRRPPDTRPPGHPPRLDRVPEMLAAGMSHREIARTLGLGKSTISRHFPHTGWSRQEAGQFGREIRRANDAMRRLGYE